LSSGEDAADDIIRERTARSREGVRGRIIDGVPKGRVCRASRREKGVDGPRVMEHGSMGECKGREEGRVEGNTAGRESYTDFYQNASDTMKDVVKLNVNKFSVDLKFSAGRSDYVDTQANRER
jgi:hypothetical protein